MASQQQQQSALLRLPMELQLMIYELAIVENEPLLLNCPCDSTYSGDPDAWVEEQVAWTVGDKQAPRQPGLTQTCAAIRILTLKMFYERNVFRAHYCVEVDVEAAIRWLESIGPHNRRTLEDFAFWDFNLSYDEWSPSYVKALQRGVVCRSMGGSMKSTPGADHTRHRVSFKDDQGYEHLVAGMFEA